MDMDNMTIDGIKRALAEMDKLGIDYKRAKAEIERREEWLQNEESENFSREFPYFN